MVYLGKKLFSFLIIWNKLVVTIVIFFYYYYASSFSCFYTPDQKLCQLFFINTFIQQRCFELIKSYCKTITMFQNAKKA